MLVLSSWKFYALLGAVLSGLMFCDALDPLLETSELEIGQEKPHSIHRNKDVSDPIAAASNSPDSPNSSDSLSSRVLATSAASSNSSPSANTVAGYIEELHFHSWKGYMDHAFPADELRPVSCVPRHRNPLQDESTLGNFSVTLIDSLDSLMIFGRIPEFIDAIHYISSDKISFTSDLVVSTFETNIRVLGALLSGHIFSTFLSQQLSQYREYQSRLSPSIEEDSAGHQCGDTGVCLGSYRPELYKLFDGLTPTLLEFHYDGQLLPIATQLGRRLQEAFDVDHNVPYSRINLRSGRLPLDAVSDETVTADAGTFLIEFGVLSLLTGDESFYLSARKSSLHIWNTRSKIDLVGMSYSVSKGTVIDRSSGINRGIDSYHEYLYKAGELFSDTQLSKAFRDDSIALRKHCQDRGTYSHCNMDSGNGGFSHFVDALGAFWPGVLAKSGSIDDALLSYYVFLDVFKQHDVLPEGYSSAYLLRPELYESTFVLSRLFHYNLPQLTENLVLPAYHKLNTTLRTRCGVAAQSDVHNPNSLIDSMESFFISETLVYLYLTVVDPDVINQRLPAILDHMVFSTEAHLFPLPEVYPEFYVGLAGQSGVDEVRRRLCRMTENSATHCQS